MRQPHLLRCLLVAAIGLVVPSLCLAQAASQAPAQTPAQTPPRAIRIMVLNDQSSTNAAASGQGSVTAAKLAADDFGGTVAGMPIIILGADHQNKADIASTTARKGFEVDEVDAIFDLSNSAASLAVQDIARERNKIVVHVGSAVSDLYGKACSPTGAMWLYDSYSLARGLTKAIYAEGGTTWFFLTADYAFGKALESEVNRTLTSLGGKMLGAVRHPIGNSDFSSFLLQAQAANPKVIGLASGGDDPMNMLKQAREFGMSGTVKFATFIFYLNYVKALGPEVAKGLQYLSGYYWERDDGSRAFAQRFAAQSKGNMPTEVHAGVYSAVHHYLRAVAQTKSHDGLVNMRQMKAMPLDDFFSPGATIRADGRLMNDQFLVEAKGPDEVKGPWDILKVLRTIKAAEIVRPIEDGGCQYLDGPTK
ncbi:ABC transporter substrate-binding protein [Xanthobacter autotrophicus]|uniref:ABC transporter substrate-binding protein n=1 Tax=Xanthobacter autotrophicus TaxID=280 RepID=UPI00372CBCC3